MSKNTSGLFSRQNAALPHLNKGEIFDLRKDIVSEFSRTRATAIEEFTNIAAFDGAALFAAVTDEPASVTTFLAGGVAALLAIPRNLAFVVGGTAAHIPPSLVITGTDAAGLPLTETVSLTGNPGQGGAGTVEGTKCFKTVSSVAFGTFAGASGTISGGIGSKLGLSNKIRSRVGLWSLLGEIVNGTDITAGLATDEFLNPPVADVDAFVILDGSSTPTLAAGGTVLAAAFTGVVGATALGFPRNITVTASNVSTYTPTGSMTVNGLDVNGNTISEVIAITAATTVAGAKMFKSVTSVTLAAQTDGAGETVTVGFGALIGLSQKARVRAGETALKPLQELAVGAIVTTGTLALPAVGLPHGSYAPSAAPDGARDYAVTYLVEKGAVQSPTTSPPYGAYVPAVTPGGALDLAITYEYDATAP
jgi:hypothetical protein